MTKADIVTRISDKTGIEKVYEELLGKGLSQEAIDHLEPVLNLSGSNTSKLNCLKEEKMYIYEVLEAL